MIDNVNIVPGKTYEIVIVAGKNVVNCFNCPTLDDARQESQGIVAKRKAKKLPTAAAYARLVLSKAERGWNLADEKIDLLKPPK
jgi:hypothetical protein